MVQCGGPRSPDPADPDALERLDNLWHESLTYAQVAGKVLRPPSEYMVGLANRNLIGMSQIMFETDYPHGDSTWPASRQTAEKIISAAQLDDHEAYLLVRGNAIACYGLARFGITE